MPFAPINGTDVYYEIDGFGDCVFMLHHGFGCAKMWEHIYPALVDHGFKTIRYDRKGYGRTAKGVFSYDFYVSDRFREASVRELEALRHWLGVDSFHVVGQCEGGVLALDYAAAHPERVKTVVISSTLCYSVMPLWQFNAQKFTKAFHELAPQSQEKFRDWHGGMVEEFFEQFRRFGGEYGKEFFDLRPVLPNVTCPTLVLYPDRSFLFEVEQGVAFYRNLPRGELAVIPRCGHNTYEEQPELYIRHVTDFLQRHRYGEGGVDSGIERPVTCAS